MAGFKVLTLLSVILFTDVLGDEILKLCSKSKDITECSQIARSEQLACVQQLHNVDCMLAIENGTTHFGSITPEEGLVGANFLQNVVVLGEFRPESAFLDDAEFATVILTRSTFQGGLASLRNKKFCHPGFKFDFSEYLWKEFENFVLKENNAEGCSAKVESGTSFEKELKAINDYFGPSCRPGPWVGSDQFDVFYEKYSKLCELCPNKNCKDAPSSLTNSIQCLVDGGDIALTTLHSVYEYFNKSGNADKIKDYAYLCRNGEISGLGNPCIWSKQPWNLIIANKDSETIVRNNLEQKWFPTYVTKDAVPGYSNEEAYISVLKQVLFPADGPYKIKLYDSAPTLLNYLNNFRNIPKPTEKCNENVRWCTVSEAEQRKCEWLSQAAANIALQPIIKCEQSQNKFACLEDIKNDKVDVVAADAHYGYISRMKNLAPLAYPDTDVVNRIRPIIVIRSSDNSITKLEDLRNKKSCFPEYGGIEWLAFVNLTRDEGILSKSSCNFGKLMSDFVDDSCMPGAHDKEHEPSTDVDTQKLCKLCQPHPYQSKTGINCNSNSENKFYGNDGALNCLKEAGEFAVVSAGDYPEFNNNDFKVLCRNGSVAAYSGLKVDENCVLTVVVDSEVLSKKTSPKNSNLQIILFHMETRFGTQFNKPFEVFNVFNNTLDLLFKDSTQGLTNVNSDKKHIKNFVNLLTDHERCVEYSSNSTGSQIQHVLPVVLTSLAIIAAMQ